MLNQISAAWIVFVQKGFLLHEFVHVVIALPFAFYLWHKTKSAKLILLLYVVTIFMDMDHLIDYWLYTGFNIDMVEFFRTNYFRQSGHIRVFFHGWEYVLAGFWWIKRRGWGSWVSAVTFGMLAHLIWDSINVGDPFLYSFLNRLLHGFSYFPH